MLTTKTLSDIRARENILASPEDYLTWYSSKASGDLGMLNIEEAQMVNWEPPQVLIVFGDADSTRIVVDPTNGTIFDGPITKAQSEARLERSLMEASGRVVGDKLVFDVWDEDFSLHN